MVSENIGIRPYVNSRSNVSEDGDLESQLNGRRDSKRHHSEGEDADLTELAAPEPVDRRNIREDDLEKEETAARHEQTHDTHDEDAGLAELAAPEPDDRGRHHRRRAEITTQQMQASPTALSSDTDLQNYDEQEPVHSHTVTQLYTYSSLILFSIMGTLARLGTEAITAYSDAPFLSPVLWSNLAGSFLIGFLVEDHRLFRQEWGIQSKEWSFDPSKINDANEENLKIVQQAHVKMKKTIPLFVGLSVGFCGSYTSFSSLLRDAFLAAMNELQEKENTASSEVLNQPTRSGGHDFEAALAILIIQFAVSVMALRIGAIAASALDRWMPTVPFTLIRHFLDPLGVILGFGCWFGAVMMSIWPPENAWRGEVIFALIFAPLGCLMRFHLSRVLNTRLPSFPLGTFCANVLGTAILGICYDLQHSNAGRLVTGCQVLVGVMEGFCGCLTTVSTFVLEIDTLRRSHAYRYGLASISVAMAFLIIIIGALKWTRGLVTPVCSG